MDEDEPKPVYGVPRRRTLSRASAPLPGDMPAVTLQTSRVVEREIEQAAIEDKKDHSLFDYNFKQLSEQFWQFCRPGFFLDHLNHASLRVILRTWLHIWIIVVLTVIQKTGDWIGPTLYVANIATIIEPAGGESVASAAFSGVATMSFIMVALLYAAVASAINWRIHGRLSMEQVFQAIYDSGECTVGDTSCVSRALLDGRYLTFRATVISIFAMILCLTTGNFYSGSRPQFRIAFVFMLIMANITIIYGNHVPYFAPWTLGRGVVVAVGLSQALKFLLSMTIFPESSGKKYILALQSAISQSRSIAGEMFRKQREVRPSEEGFVKFLEIFPQKAISVIKPMNKLTLHLLFAKYELTYSRFDHSDLQELGNRIKSNVNSLYAFKFLYIEFNERVGLAREYENVKSELKEDCILEEEEDEDEEALTDSPEADQTTAHDPRVQYYHIPHGDAHPQVYKTKKKSKKRIWKHQKGALSKEYKKTSNFELRRREQLLEAVGTEEQGLLSVDQLDSLYRDVLDHYEPVIQEAQKVLEEVVAWLKEANEFRMIALFIPSIYAKREKAQKECHQKLDAAVMEMERVYREHTESKSVLKKAKQSKTYTIAQYDYVLSTDAFYGYLCKEYVRLIRGLAWWCLYLDKEQPKPKLIFGRFTKGHVKKHSKRRFSVSHGHDTEPDLGVPENVEEYTPLANTQTRNVDATPPRNVLHRVGTLIFKIKKQYWTPELAYSFKRGSVGVIPAILYFVRPTLPWAFGNNIVWVGIMAGMTMNPHPGDTIYATIARCVYTVLGGLTGMVAFYICAGSGKGNAIGYAAVFAVLAVPIAFWRHFNGRAVPTAGIVLGITAFMVAGASWVDSHIPQPGNEIKPGWSVFYHRTAAVVTGVALAFIFTMVPHAQTSKKAVRIIHSDLLTGIGDIQSHIINFALQRYDNPNVHVTPIGDNIASKIWVLFAKLAAVDVMQGTLRFEPPLTGYWPRHHYILLTTLSREVLHMFPFMYSLINTMRDADRIPELVTKMGWSNPRILSGIYSVLYMASKAIVMGEPLPSVTTGRLSEEYQHHLASLAASWDNKASLIDQLSDDYLEHDGKWIMAGMRMSELLYERLDGIMILVKQLVGEYYDTDTRLFDWNIEIGVGTPFLADKVHDVDDSKKYER